MASRYDQQGAVQVPLATSGVSAGGSIVSVADPVVEDLLDDFKTVLNNKLSAAWSKVAGQISSAAVVGTYPYEPVPELSRLTWRWPALFMWRSSEKYTGHSLVYTQSKTTGHLMFVLPPLPYEKAVQLEPIRVAARVVLTMFIHERGDPDVSSGASPMSSNTLKSFGFTQGEYTYLQGPEMGLAHPVLDMTYEMEERQSHVSANYSDFTRVDTTIDIASETGSSTVTTLVTTYAPFPTVDVDAPYSGDDYTVGQTITATGSYSYATSITVSASVNGGAYSSLGAATTTGGTWSYAHVAATANVGTFVLRITALADGMSAEDTVSVDISSA